MRPIELVRQAQGMRMVDEDGDVERLELLPPLEERELAALRARLPCPLPAEVEELVRFSRGFANGPLEEFEFAGIPGGEFDLEALLPHALALAHDGYGNFWVVDLTARSTSWGPIDYLSHDPAVLVHQCDGLAHFIGEVLRFANPPHESELDQVHEEASRVIWRENPGLLSFDECSSSADPELRAFARTLDESYALVDLRRARTGEGLSWGRYGPRTVVRRHGDERIFAYQKKTRLQRMLGR